MDAFPLVSIGIPSFNYGRFIGRAICSATAQTYPNIEIIVSDNASTDTSVEIISKLAELDPRIRLTVNESNVGAFENIRCVRERCKGEYIVFLSADDMMFPHHVSAAIEYYRTHPECDIRHTSFAVMEADEQAEAVSILDHPGHHGIRYVSAREEFGYGLVADGHYMWPSIVFPRRVLNALGHLATHVTASDIEFMFRANRAGFRVAFDGTPSISYRRHSGAISSRENFMQTGKHLHDWLTLYDENLLPETLSRCVGKRRRIVSMIESRLLPLRQYAGDRADELFKNEAELFQRVKAKAETIPDRLDGSSAPYPRFSIILPTMSGLGQLKRSIDSVLSQTEGSWELVVVSNDGHNIEGILRSWMDPERLVYVETLNTANAAGARNVALRLARGETIAYLDEGDTWHPQYLEVLGRVLDSSQADVVRVGAACAIYDAREFGPGELLRRDAAMFAPPAAPYVDELGLYAPLSAISHRAYCTELVAGFNEGLPLMEDWEFVARLVANPQFRKVDTGDVMVESACYRGLAQQTLGKRLGSFTNTYQAVGTALKADPALMTSHLGEIVKAANALLADPTSADRLHAFIRSLHGPRRPAVTA